MKTEMPSVHLDIHSSWFDLLITVLDTNATMYKENDAETLKAELMRYSRSYFDSDNELCADVRLYPKRAAMLIIQLLNALCFQHVPEHSYCSKLTEKGVRKNGVK